MRTSQNKPNIKQVGLLSSQEKEVIECVHEVLGLQDGLIYERFSCEKPGHHLRAEGHGFIVEFHTSPDFPGEFSVFIEKPQEIEGSIEAVRIFGKVCKTEDATPLNVISLDTKTPSAVYLTPNSHSGNRPKILIDLRDDFCVCFPMVTAPNSYNDAPYELTAMERETAAYCIFTIAQKLLKS